jgi:hypothetical protein
VTVLDAYSRYVVHWELLTTMTAAAVRVVIHDALKKTGANPQVVTDNGSQFTAKDFKQLVRDFDLEHIKDPDLPSGVQRPDRAVPPKHTRSTRRSRVAEPGPSARDHRPVDRVLQHTAAARGAEVSSPRRILAG